MLWSSKELGHSRPTRNSRAKMQRWAGGPCQPVVGTRAEARSRALAKHRTGPTRLSRKRADRAGDPASLRAFDLAENRVRATPNSNVHVRANTTS